MASNRFAITCRSTRRRLLISSLLVIWIVILVLTHNAGYRWTGNAFSDLPRWARNSNTSRKIEKNAEDLTKPSVWFWTSDAWTNVKNFCGHFENFVSAPFVPSDRNIRVYFPGDRQDVLETRLAKLQQMLQFPAVQEVVAKLKTSPRYSVIDLGSQFVMFSIYAATLGHRVLVVTPEMENILSLSKTLEEADMTSQATLVCSTSAGSRQAYPVKTFDLCSQSLERSNITEVLTTHLDDVLPFVTFEKVVMVLDSHDRIAVFDEALQMFHGLSILVLMEVTPAYNDGSYQQLEKFLQARYFVPSVPLHFEEEVSKAGYILWTKHRELKGNRKH